MSTKCTAIGDQLVNIESTHPKFNRLFNLVKQQEGYFDDDYHHYFPVFEECSCGSHYFLSVFWVMDGSFCTSDDVKYCIVKKGDRYKDYKTIKQYSYVRAALNNQ